MPSRVAAADEPFESRDLELGRAVRSWVDEHAASFSLQLDGPLDAPGMDPTWILRVHGERIEAEVHLFYGPHVDVSVLPAQAPGDEVLVGGEDSVTVERLEEMLDGLERMERGGAVPGWLHRPQSL